MPSQLDHDQGVQTAAMVFILHEVKPPEIG